ncbi:uncharacterized protein LOC114828464 [Galendromus occidentalis]|uniref:Uncharacterized protein LOC114828464 n=1 Tax=Galendromus occidentalis TaxID=34638 RepID=A0AAJ7WIU7_9ACAR|nr:uncharacterized protein LOC114828464 [Galendromus occidentalis]
MDDSRQILSDTAPPSSKWMRLELLRAPVNALIQSSAVPTSRKLVYTTIMIGFALILSDLINKELLVVEQMPEKNLALSVVFFTPAIRVPFPMSHNFTRGRDSSLVVPALQSRFYTVHYQHRIGDYASKKIIKIAQALAQEHSTRCSRSVFHAPQVSNLLLSAEQMYIGYYGLTRLTATPNFKLSDDDRMKRYNLRNQMAAHNEANLYTVPCRNRNAASFVRYLNRKAEDSVYVEDLKGGSNIMDLLQFFWSAGDKLPRWAKIKDIIYCYNAVVREIVKGFEYQLASEFLRDLQNRLKDLENPQYNIVFHVTDYEELFAINKFLKLFPPATNLIPAFAVEMKIFKSGSVIVNRHYHDIQTQRRHSDRLKKFTVDELRSQLVNALGDNGGVMSKN